ncbi:hypothetical protein DENIS_1561 [Desulfonema ishimotonii]|uniref:Uncharacterized protein n=1 Tax=Desulfonema ishimotonii TaxID=45657 RepID=A0A401FUH6_9BACT|nr:hypothetical protein [Desulfonema ishimotonii]GBC60604.1 hypothetical protein DENIS_1561 [Desulfonema ishimotonii]
MFRLISILAAVGAIVYAIRWYKKQLRKEDIDRMSPDDLVDAIIRREISILEVPSGHRDAVNRTLKKIQEELDGP